MKNKKEEKSHFKKLNFPKIFNAFSTIMGKNPTNKPKKRKPKKERNKPSPHFLFLSHIISIIL